TNDKTGCVIGALTVGDEDDIMLITVGGQMVRTSVKDIRETGRNTQGVKLIELEQNDQLYAWRIAAGFADVFHRGADHLAADGDEHDIVFVTNCEGAND